MDKKEIREVENMGEMGEMEDIERKDTVEPKEPVRMIVPTRGLTPPKPSRDGEGGAGEGEREEEDFEDREPPVRQTTGIDPQIDLQREIFDRGNGKLAERAFIPKGMLISFAAARTQSKAVGKAAQVRRKQGKTLMDVFIDEYFTMSFSVEGRWLKAAIDLSHINEEKRASGFMGNA